MAHALDPPSYRKKTSVQPIVLGLESEGYNRKVGAEDRLISALMADIEQNQLILPTLPELALKVRKMIDDPDITADKLAKIITTDPAISARLLQIANSVFFTGLNPVNNVQTAVIRLGAACVRNVLSSLVVGQLYQSSTTTSIKSELQALWVHSTRVAAISQVISKRFTKLKPEEAMLAGLLHDIGKLPILHRAVTFPELLNDKKALQHVIETMHMNIGRLILKEWHFPEELVTVAAEHEDFQRDAGPDIDYTDVVLIANLHSYLGQKQPRKPIDWSTIPAFNKLGLTPEESILAMTEAQSEISNIQKLLLS